MRGYPERTLATRAKWLLDTREDAEVSATEWVGEMEAVLKELANASEPEPVGEAVDFNGWRIVRWKEKESSFPLGTKFYTSPPALSVPDGWRSAIAKEFPLYDEDGIDEDKHCCEWVILQERKRLHKILATAATIAAEKGGQP